MVLVSHFPLIYLAIFMYMNIERGVLGIIANKIILNRTKLFLDSLFY